MHIGEGKGKRGCYDVSELQVHHDWTTIGRDSVVPFLSFTNVVPAVASRRSRQHAWFVLFSSRISLSFRTRILICGAMWCVFGVGYGFSPGPLEGVTLQRGRTPGTLRVQRIVLGSVATTCGLLR